MFSIVIKARITEELAPRGCIPDPETSLPAGRLRMTKRNNQNNKNKVYVNIVLVTLCVC